MTSYVVNLHSELIIFEVELYLGTSDTNDKDSLIFESDGSFQSGVDYTFQAISDAEALPNPITESDAFVTLEMRMDSYPGVRCCGLVS